VRAADVAGPIQDDVRVDHDRGSGGAVRCGSALAGRGYRLPRGCVDDPGALTNPTAGHRGGNAVCIVDEEAAEGRRPRRGGPDGGQGGKESVKNVRAILEGPDAERRNAVVAALADQRVTIVAELEDNTARGAWTPPRRVDVASGPELDPDSSWRSCTPITAKRPRRPSWCTDHRGSGTADALMWPGAGVPEYPLRRGL
jgi:hypothetical protein